MSGASTTCPDCDASVPHWRKELVRMVAVVLVTVVATLALLDVVWHRATDGSPVRASHRTSCVTASTC